jgi:hypothetical protein
MYACMYVCMNAMHTDDKAQMRDLFFENVVIDMLHRCMHGWMDESMHACVRVFMHACTYMYMYA